MPPTPDPFWLDVARGLCFGTAAAATPFVLALLLCGLPGVALHLAVAGVVAAVAGRLLWRR